MKKYIIKKGNIITLVEEDWKQSIVADTYTYSFIGMLGYLLYLYTSNFGRSIIFEISFILFIIVFLISSFNKEEKVVNKDEVEEILNEFFE